MRKSRAIALRRQRWERLFGWTGFIRPVQPKSTKRPVAEVAAPPAVVEAPVPEPVPATASAPVEEQWVAESRAEKTVTLPNSERDPAVAPAEPVASEKPGGTVADAPVASVLSDHNPSGPGAEVLMHLPEVEDEQRRELEEAKRASRRVALLISAGVHVVALIAMFIIVIPGRGTSPPEIVVSVPDKAEEDHIDERQKKQDTLRPAPKPKTSIALHQVVANVSSSVAMPTVDIQTDYEGTAMMPETAIGLGRGHMNFGKAGLNFQKIGVLKVRAKKLGVILDISPSMTSYLSDLRKEIKGSFKGSIFREVLGCALASTDGREETPVFASFEPKAVMKAIEELVDKERVDAVYWFSDLQDRQTEEALEQLQELLRFKDFNRKVRFYVRSVDREPSEALAEIIDRSGGELQVDGAGG